MVSLLSFNFFFILLIPFIFGCGVKANPLNPPETAIDSYVNSFSENYSDELDKANENQDTSPQGKKK